MSTSVREPRPRAELEARRRRARNARLRRRRQVALGAIAGASLIAGAGVGAATKESGARGDERPAHAKPRLAELPRGGRTIFPDFRVVAYYGAPQDHELGELGIGSPDHAARKLLRQARLYANKTRPVLPAMELITVLADAAAGQDGLYRTRQSDALIARYLGAARRAKALLVLDIQPGHASFIDEARRLDRWLREPDVGIALDPEWHTPGAVPGRVVGSTTAADVNAVARHVAAIVREGRLPEKLFVVHEFTEDMVQGKPQIIRPPGLAVTMNVDGFGDGANKLGKYRAFTTDGTPFYNGLKLFYHEDTGLMRPPSVLALRPPPDLIVYE